MLFLWPESHTIFSEGSSHAGWLLLLIWRNIDRGLVAAASRILWWWGWRKYIGMSISYEAIFFSHLLFYVLHIVIKSSWLLFASEIVWGAVFYGFGFICSMKVTILLFSMCFFTEVRTMELRMAFFKTLAGFSTR